MKKAKIVNIILFLIIFSLFTFTCDNFIQLNKSGNCSVSLSIGGVHEGRTIMPSPEDNQFSRYELIFTPTGDTKSKIITEEWLNCKSSGTVGLNAGTYDLSVTAFMDGSEEPDAKKNVEITVIAGQKNEIKLNLDVIIKEGTGKFCWEITYALMMSSESGNFMTITPLNDDTIEEQIEYFEIVYEEGASIPNPNAGSIDLKTGYYRVVINLRNHNEYQTEFIEILHIYKGMESVLKYEFTPVHFTNGIIFVTTGEDSVETPPRGSLRWAISQAKINDSSTIIIDSKVKRINLKNKLEIIKESPDEISNNITIEGNGVIITGSSNDASLLEIKNNVIAYGIYLEITIRRVHFKGGKAVNGGAINNNCAEIILESCIFSENYAKMGGAIYNFQIGVLDIRGCTFYGNSVDNSGKGSAIYIVPSDSPGGYIYLTGNIFYKNNQLGINIVQKAISQGYNVVDDIYDNWGWLPSEDGDIYIPGLTVTPDTFKIQGNSANILPEKLTDYPTIDFYGYPIKAGGAAGAVQ